MEKFCLVININENIYGMENMNERYLNIRLCAIQRQTYFHLIWYLTSIFFWWEMQIATKQHDIDNKEWDSEREREIVFTLVLLWNSLHCELSANFIIFFVLFSFHNNTKVNWTHKHLIHTKHTTMWTMNFSIHWVDEFGAFMRWELVVGVETGWLVWFDLIHTFVYDWCATKKIWTFFWNEWFEIRTFKFG